MSGYFSDLDDGAIRVGILHSLSGTLTASERPLQQLLVMLIERLNDAGGLLRRPVEAVILDPASNPGSYAELARTMLKERGVAVIFGCWTSASRKHVLPVLEQHGGILFYPSQYEGEEASPRIFYTGATPRQQALPAIDYLLGQGFRRFILLGTDYVYPRTTNAIIKAYLRERDADVVLESYAAFGENIWRETIERLRKLAAHGDTAIVSTISGDFNVHFFREFSRQGIRADELPVMTLSIGEAELPALTGAHMEGHLTAWSYLHALDHAENRAFISQWRDFAGDPDGVTNDPMEATLIGFRLWTAAVERAGTTDAEIVRRTLAGMSTTGPSGHTVRMDERNQHLHKPAFVGRISRDSRILPVWTSEGVVPPDPWSPWLQREAPAA